MPQHCHRVCAHVCTFLWDVHDEQREALTVATGVLMQRWVAVIMNWLTQIIILPKLQLSHFSVLNGNKLIYKSGIQLKPLYTLCDHFGKDGPFCVKKTKQKQNKWQCNSLCLLQLLMTVCTFISKCNPLFISKISGRPCVHIHRDWVWISNQSQGRKFTSHL